MTTAAQRCRPCGLLDTPGPQHKPGCPYRRPGPQPRPTVVPTPRPVCFNEAEVMRVLRASEEPLSLGDIASQLGILGLLGLSHQEVMARLVYAGRAEKLKTTDGRSLYQVPWRDED